MKKLSFFILALLLSTPSYAQVVGGGSGGVTSINSTTGAFTFTGAGVSCTGTSCAFSGVGTGVSSFGFTNANGANGVVIGTTSTPVLTLSPTAGGNFASSANNLGFFASTTSAQLAGVLSDETGTGVAVFSASPTFTGTANFAALSSAGNINANTFTAGNAIQVHIDASGNISTSGTLISGQITANLTGNVTGNVSGTSSNITGIAAIANGGTGTATPGLVAGTNVTITGSWPNQTINSSGGSTTYDTLRRSPLRTDDASKGYNVGDWWVYDRTVWQNYQNTTGTSIWTKQFNSNLAMCDAVTGAAGCYGVYRLKAAYTGNAFQVTRSSDSTTQAIGFDVNGYADWKATDTFCAGTTCGVSVWYDQSGNGSDLSQATQANMPQIFAGVFVGNSRAIAFGNVIAASNYLNSFMTNTSTAITNRQNLTTLIIAHPDYNYQTAFYDVGQPTPKYSIYGDNYTTFGTKVNAGSVLALNGSIVTKDQVMLVEDNAGTTTWAQNNFTKSVAGVTSSSASGLYFGGTSLANYPGRFSATAFVIFNSALSATNQNILVNSAYQMSGVVPQNYNNFVQIGDSITCCTGSNFNAELTQNIMQTIIQPPYNSANLGVAGITAATYATVASTVATDSFQTGKNNIVQNFLGTNDMAGGTSAASTFSSIQSICTSFTGAGFSQCLVATPLPRGGGFSGGQTSGGFETSRQSLITSIQGAYSSTILDIGSDAVIGSTSALTGPLFCADQIHPCVPGESYEASFFASIVQGFLK